MIHARLLLTPVSALLLVLAAVPSACADEAARAVDRFRSAYYEVHSDLSPALAREVADHMDIVYEEYTRRFEHFPIRDAARPILHVYETEERYLGFLASLGINGRNSGGMFIRRGSKAYLASFLGDRSYESMESTLRHEGFHQFASMRIGPLAAWVNEGLADYFGDAALVRDRLHVGLVAHHKLFALQKAIREGRTLPFERMLSMDNERWGRTLRGGGDEAVLMYDQAWSMVHFLINASGGKYHEYFERFVELQATGKDPRAAFTEAFGTSETDTFESAWRKYVLALEPDPISTAAERLDFLASGILFLHERGRSVADLDDLERKLRRIGYWRSKRTNLVVRRLSARNRELFDAPQPERGRARIEMRFPAGTPPTVRVVGLEVKVEQSWRRDEGGKFVPEIEFR